MLYKHLASRALQGVKKAVLHLRTRLLNGPTELCHSMLKHACHPPSLGGLCHVVCHQAALYSPHVV